MLVLVCYILSVMMSMEETHHGLLENTVSWTRSLKHSVALQLFIITWTSTSTTKQATEREIILWPDKQIKEEAQTLWGAYRRRRGASWPCSRLPSPVRRPSRGPSPPPPRAASTAASRTSLGGRPPPALPLPAQQPPWPPTPEEKIKNPGSGDTNNQQETEEQTHGWIFGGVESPRK